MSNRPSHDQYLRKQSSSRGVELLLLLVLLLPPSILCLHFLSKLPNERSDSDDKPISPEMRVLSALFSDRFGEGLHGYARKVSLLVALICTYLVEAMSILFHYINFCRTAAPADRPFFNFFACVCHESKPMSRSCRWNPCPSDHNTRRIIRTAHG